MERKEDADNIAVVFAAVKNFSDFEFLISTVRDKIMANSTTRGYCYAYRGIGHAEALHKPSGQGLLQ